MLASVIVITIKFAAISIMMLMLLSYLHSSEFVKAIGLTDDVNRIYALREAIYWSGRSMLHKDLEQINTTRLVYGKIVGLAPDGLVIINTFEGEKIEKHRIKLADVKVDDPTKFAQEVISVQNINAEFEFYNSGEVVVWIKHQPWNVHLIVCGAVRPDENSSTNIVEKIMTEYYWRLSKGVNQS